MPAEWESHEATWIGWPHNSTDWPGKMSAIQWVYGEIVRQLSQSELVRILVNDKTHELKVKSPRIYLFFVFFELFASR